MLVLVFVLALALAVVAEAEAVANEANDVNAANAANDAAQKRAAERGGYASLKHTLYVARRSEHTALRLHIPSIRLQLLPLHICDNTTAGSATQTNKQSNKQNKTNQTNHAQAVRSVHHI